MENKGSDENVHAQNDLSLRILRMIEATVSFNEALPGVLGNIRIKAIYFRGTREQKSKTESNRGTKAILGNREHRKSRF